MMDHSTLEVTRAYLLIAFSTSFQEKLVARMIPGMLAAGTNHIKGSRSEAGS
jgi:hypothetical protein